MSERRNNQPEIRAPRASRESPERKMFLFYLQKGMETIKQGNSTAKETVNQLFGEFPPPIDIRNSLYGALVGALEREEKKMAVKRKDQMVERVFADAKRIDRENRERREELGIDRGVDSSKSDED